MRRLKKGNSNDSQELLQTVVATEAIVYVAKNVGKIIPGLLVHTP